MENESFLHTRPLLVSGLLWHADSRSSGKLRMGLSVFSWIYKRSWVGRHSQRSLITTLYSIQGNLKLKSGVQVHCSNAAWIFNVPEAMTYSLGSFFQCSISGRNLLLISSPSYIWCSLKKPLPGVLSPDTGQKRSVSPSLLHTLRGCR